MKKINVILALVMAVTLGHAQFVVGPNSGPALVIGGGTNVFAVTGKITTNVPTSLVYNIPIGVNGVGFFVHTGTSGSLGVTNATIRMGVSVNGTDWSTSNAVAIVNFPQTGVTPFFYYTNLIGNHVNWSNARFLRINSIQNTNSETLYISNVLWSVAQ